MALEVSDILDESEHVDYNDYNEELAAEIDSRIANDSWLSNRKQRYYVVQTVERTLNLSYPQDVKGRRKKAQTKLTNQTQKCNSTIQKACHQGLFEGHEAPPKSPQGEKQWHKLFEDVIQDIERERRSKFPR